ncbi:MAG TPA: dihydrolipoyl dehydrogenase, partial [Armatimonadota bacterium]|nr:dihydrolipoyl dehydrogenase [Armatimonadota bacterium]
MEPYDVVVIGGGPGGYVAAIRAAQLGLRTALVEREELGGVCLNWGCVPSKALIHNANLVNTLKNAKEFGISFDNLRCDYAPAVERSRRVSGRLVKGIQMLMKKNHVDVYKGSGFIPAPGKVQVRPDGTELETRTIIVATGGHARTIPGITFDDPLVLSSREAIVMKDLPESLLVIGGGPIGIEFSYVFNAFGCNVTVVEMLPHILPNDEPEIAEVVTKQLTKQGLKIFAGTKMSSLDTTSGKVRAHLSGPKGEEDIEADRVLLAVGVAPNSTDLGLEALGVNIQRGAIQVDDRMATNVPGIYAIGDVTGKMLLAHVASAQGEVAAETIAGLETKPLRYHDMPRATYCHPQAASVGLTEPQARERGHEVKIGSFPFRANGKALGEHDWEGF